MSKLDQIWATKINDEPSFTEDFDNCRNDFEIAEWIKKYFSKEIDWCVKQFKDEWTKHLITQNIRFAEDRNMMRLALNNLEVTFRRDIQKIYVYRHKHDIEQGIIKPK